MHTNRFAVPALLLTALAGTGCATMINGRHQDVLVLSEPSGAAIQLNGVPVGSTPTTVRMRRRGPAVLEVKKDGFAPSTIPVANSSSRAVYGNLIFLNPLAAQGMDSTDQWAISAAAWFTGTMALDFFTGGAYKRPPVVTVTLSPLPDGAAHTPPTAPGEPQRLPGWSPRAVLPGRLWRH